MNLHRLALGLVASGSLAGGCLLDRSGLLADPDAGGAGGSSSSSGGQGGAMSSSSTAGNGGVGPGGGGSGPENCVDGVDNDGDNLADCSDSDCVDYACVPSMAGALAYLSQVPQASACPSDAPAAAYSACDCGTCNVDPGTCTITAEIHNNPTCNNLVGGPYVSGSGCINAIPDGDRWVLATTAPNNDQTCAAPVGQVSAATRNACAAPATGACPSGAEVCVPSPPALISRCVLVDASATCLPPYTVRVPVFEGAVNTCGCTCSDSGQGCASPVMNVSAGSSSCMSPGTVTATTNVCSPLGFSDSYSTPFGTGDVKCDMDATPDTAVTARAFCCQP